MLLEFALFGLWVPAVSNHWCVLTHGNDCNKTTLIIPGKSSVPVQRNTGVTAEPVLQQNSKERLEMDGRSVGNFCFAVFSIGST